MVVCSSSRISFSVLRCIIETGPVIRNDSLTHIVRKVSFDMSSLYQNMRKICVLVKFSVNLCYLLKGCDLLLSTYPFMASLSLEWYPAAFYITFQGRRKLFQIGGGGVRGKAAQNLLGITLRFQKNTILYIRINYL